jgi:hypothetical protein
MYDELEGRALTEVLESRVWWRTPGTKTLEFARAFAAAFHGPAWSCGHERYRSA